MFGLDGRMDEWMGGFGCVGGLFAYVGGLS